MEIEDTSLYVFKLGDHRVVAITELFLLLLAKGVPGGDITPAGTNHLMMLVQFDHPPFGQLYMFRVLDEVIQFKHIVIARGHITPDACPLELVVGIGQPFFDSSEHLGSKDLIDSIGCVA